jgi:hypothetical protein
MSDTEGAALVRPIWTVSVVVEDADGTLSDRSYDVTAKGLGGALDAGRRKARKANPYAEAVWVYGAVLRTGRSASVV